MIYGKTAIVDESYIRIRKPLLVYLKYFLIDPEYKWFINMDLTWTTSWLSDWFGIPFHQAA